MKRNWKTQRWLQSALLGLGLAASTTLCSAATDRVLSTFDYDVTGWSKDWGSAAPEFDPGQDATGNSGGACRIYGDFGADQNALTVGYSLQGNPWWNNNGDCWNMSDYKSLEFDIKWDTANSTLSIADFNTPPKGGEGGMRIWALDYAGTVNAGQTPKWPDMGVVQIPAGAADGWVHISFPINPAIPNIDPSKGITFKKWVQQAQKDAGGTFSFWVDNVILKGSTPLPPPSVSVGEKPVPGLAFVAASGGQWDRQNIRTVSNTYSWVGASGPVSYSVTINQSPGTNYAGFGFHFYFVPGTPDPNRNDPDWHEPNILLYNIGFADNGGAWSDVHYKTNAPDDNGILWGAGGLPGAWGDTALGTWTITFANNTTVTTTSPTGQTVTTNIPPEVASIFDGPVEVCVGIMPGDPARIGQMATLSAIKFEGMKGAEKIDHRFIGQSLDTNIWRINAASAAYGIQEIPTDAAFYVDWTLPATGFSLQGSPKVAGPWTTPAPTGLDLGAKHRILLRTSDLPGSDTGFWRLIKRNYTKLQVLLPGETAAPGTPTGKTGTPTPQTSGIPFNIIVNAVDNDWYVVKVNPTVTITSTDASFSPPMDAPLVNGTATFEVSLSSGSSTITATDTADNTKKGTSSTVTAQ